MTGHDEKIIAVNLSTENIKTIIQLVEEKKWSIGKMGMMTEENKIHAILYLDCIIDKLNGKE